MINDDKLSSLERLHKLKTDGVITEDDFEKAKNDLLNGPARPAAVIQATATWEDGLPPEQDHIAWMLLPLKRYAQFNGRSSRREFWMFQLAVVLFTAVALILVAIGKPEYSFESSTFSDSVIGLWALGMIGLVIPTVAVQVRRFHDQDKAGWFALFNLIPYLGYIIVLVFMTIDGTPGENQFGADPKQR